MKIFKRIYRTHVGKREVLYSSV